MSEPQSTADLRILDEMAKTQLPEVSLIREPHRLVVAGRLSFALPLGV